VGEIKFNDAREFRILGGKGDRLDQGAHMPLRGVGIGPPPYSPFENVRFNPSLCSTYGEPQGVSIRQLVVQSVKQRIPMAGGGHPRGKIHLAYGAAGITVADLMVVRVIVVVNDVWHPHREYVHHLPAKPPDWQLQVVAHFLQKQRGFIKAPPTTLVMEFAAVIDAMADKRLTN